MCTRTYIWVYSEDISLKILYYCLVTSHEKLFGSKGGSKGKNKKISCVECFLRKDSRDLLIVPDENLLGKRTKN